MTLNTAEFNENLQRAVNSLDRDRAAELCNELIVHLRDRDDAYPTNDARTVLGLLRSKRYFDLMQTVADALIQNGQSDARVRRQYAQAQLDLGHLTAAISTLKDLETDTAPGGDNANPVEYAEAGGLLGRAYKDLYVLAEKPSLSRSRHFLEQAIKHYRDIYTDDNSKIWQGINCVALIRRADSDGVQLTNVAGPKLLADSMATEILAEVKRRDQNRRADTWDFATGVEACVGLDDHEKALAWLMRYLKSDWADAFELGSTYRQLTRVWKLHPGKPPGDKILPILKAALIEKQGSEIEIGVADAAHEKLDELTQDAGYERILGTEGFRSLKWLQKCMRRANAIAKIEDSNGEAVGTGFVVRGGDLKHELGDELLILTNSHVISDDELVSQALRPSKAVLVFELWDAGHAPEFKVQKLLRTSRPDDLDFSLLRLTPAIENIDPVPVTQVLPLVDGQQRAYIIGHPRGRKLSFSIHDNYLLDYDMRLLHYRSPTEPGSSGSPVFNGDWELIGLHHRGTHKMPRLNGKEGTYAANEGIWIKAIIADLAEADLD